MITCVVRASYANVFEPKETPSGQMKYSISLLVPKTEEQGIKEMNDAIQEAIQKGLEKGTFPKTAVGRLRLPIRDGDEEFDSGAKTADYKGMVFLNASSNNQPGVVDQRVKPILDPMEFYSGCWCRADINFFPYNVQGNAGIGVGLNNLQKVRDDARLDGRQAAEDAFAQYAEPEEEQMEGTEGGGPTGEGAPF